MELGTVKAVVTGGASGLGRATAERLVAEGSVVALLDRPASAGADVAKAMGSKAIFTPADVTSAEEVGAALQTASDRLGGINVLVNCAGIGTPMKTFGRGGSAKLDEFTRVIQVNLIGTFNCIRLVAALMAKNTPGAEGERGVVDQYRVRRRLRRPDRPGCLFGFQGRDRGHDASDRARPRGAGNPRHDDRARNLRHASALHACPTRSACRSASRCPFPQRLGRPEEFAALALHIIENAMLNGETIRLDGAIRMQPR